MNQTTIRRQRLSASIAAAAQRDPSTAEILRETGFAGAGLLVSTYDPSKKTIPADLEDFSGDSPPPFLDGSPCNGIRVDGMRVRELLLGLRTLEEWPAAPDHHSTKRHGARYDREQRGRLRRGWRDEDDLRSWLVMIRHSGVGSGAAWAIPVDSEEQVTVLLFTLRRRAPWAFFGYNEPYFRGWKNDQEGVSAAANARYVATQAGQAIEPPSEEMPPELLRE